MAVGQAANLVISVSQFLHARLNRIAVTTDLQAYLFFRYFFFFGGGVLFFPKLQDRIFFLLLLLFFVSWEK